MTSASFLGRHDKRHTDFSVSSRRFVLYKVDETVVMRGSGVGDKEPPRRSRRFVRARACPGHAPHAPLGVGGAPLHCATASLLPLLLSGDPSAFLTALIFLLILHGRRPNGRGGVKLSPSVYADTDVPRSHNHSDCAR